MPLVMDSPGNINLLRSYAGDAVRIGDTDYRRCVVVAPTAVLSDWPPDTLDAIHDEHLAALFALAPEVVLIGVRGAQRFAPAPLRRRFNSQQIGLECIELGAACRTYNVLASEGRKVVAVLFPA